jgi:hypothetical protein
VVVLRWVTQAGRWYLCLKPEIEPPGLGCGCAVANCGLGRWVEVVECRVRGNNGVVVLRWVTQAGRWDLGLKPEIEPPGLGFRCATANGSGAQ